ncbi:hypothetical protein KQI61_15315 [Anaerocolumna aminovalerica]|uniref:hypothetical protein n=1 Tax=Anaerocolumna aminovalerica TaxID=1527 RepID=UPI001C0F11B9|nr:hypothetical protein [Anaerocolumna aminovalerica]MBU5333567.1 hypothetical protein [Anaerocolumna aminovalerica]
MKGNDSKKKVVTIIENIIQRNPIETTNILLDKLENKLSRPEIYSILETTNLMELDVIVLLWVYDAFLEFYNIDKLETYFTDIEIKKSQNFEIERKYTGFPLTFENVIKVNEGEEYKFLLSIQDLNSILGLGIIKLIEGMQRETITNMYNNRMVSHVSYNDDKAREIAKNIIRREYHPKDDISIHLVTDGEEDYTYDGNKLVVKSGTIALLDGQHRASGIEYALLEDKNINMLQSIYFTVGSVEMGQDIIAQHEKQTPIKSELVESYTKSDGKFIFTKLSTNSDIKEYYKFVDNYDTVVKGYGIATSADIIKSINKYYSNNNKTMKLKERNDIGNWLIEFFTQLIYIYEDDLINFKTVRINKWNVKPYAFPFYIYLSSYLYNKKDWKELLKNILGKFDFTIEPEGNSYKVKSRNAIKTLNAILESGV